ncbi:MAG: HIT family protein [Pseudomonadota bacterium]|nr:HIT family protein [Pseudomonadota bacterium]
MDSIFTKIIKGELPGHFVWQDDQCVAIMTIAPIRPGHVLLIPREQIDHWDDLPAALASHLMLTGQRIAKAIKKALSPNRVGMMIAGFEVAHVHLHILPAESLGAFDFSQAEQPDAHALAEKAHLIRQALESLAE